MDFGEVDVGRANTRRAIGALRGEHREPRLAQLAIFAPGQHRCGDPCGARPDRERKPFEVGGRTDQRGCCPVADRGAHRASQGIGHLPVGEHLFDAHRYAILRLGIIDRGAMILGRRHGDLALGRAVSLHVPQRLHRVGVHEDRAIEARIERLPDRGPRLLIIGAPLLGVILVDAAVEQRGGPLGRVGEVGPFDPDRQAELALAT